MSVAAKHLHLKEHCVLDGSGNVFKLAAPVECKGIVGSDDRLLLVLCFLPWVNPLALLFCVVFPCMILLGYPYGMVTFNFGQDK